jgi:endogenous inhibitor of DNA gyrase (YacG/DUF329 family)
MNQQGKKAKKSEKEITHCKICGTPLPSPHDPTRSPFCSERCRMNDLSKWFGENYRSASHPVPSSQGEEEQDS